MKRSRMPCVASACGSGLAARASSRRRCSARRTVADRTLRAAGARSIVSVARRIERERCGARILEKRGIEMIRQRGRDDDIGRVEYAPSEVIGEDRVVSEFQMRAMFLRAGAERNHDDGLRAQNIGGLLPGDVAEPDAFRPPAAQEWTCVVRATAATARLDTSSTTRIRLLRTAPGC